MKRDKLDANCEREIREFIAQKQFLADNLTSTWHLLTTISFHFLSFLTYFLLKSSLIFVLTYSLVTLRWFMIYHDCAHLSYWTNPSYCVRLGQILSFITATPFKYWQTNHILHHTNSGDRTSTKYKFNDTILLTVKQYLNLPKWKRYGFRIFRDPFIFFTIVPFVNFVIHYRFVKDSFLTNFLFCFYWFFLYSIGGKNLLLLIIVSSFISSSLGIILFHLQHSYNPSYVNATTNKYDLYKSAVHGSSSIQIPRLLKWFTMGIEYHQIHHLTTRIPGYNLEFCYNQSPNHFWTNTYQFDSLKKVFDSLCLTLWDEDEHRFVSFYDLN